MTSNNVDFLQSYSPSLPTPVNNRITSLVSAVEGANARNAVLEKENQGLSDTTEARKRNRAGITVRNLGTHVVSTEDCLERVTAAEAVTTARKTKGKVREVPEGSPGLLQDIETVLEAFDLDLPA